MENKVVEICDFSSVMKIIRDYISDSRALSQTDLLYEVFASFMADEINMDYDFDNAQVCRWFNGQAAITPRISRYYQENKMEEVIIKDIYSNLLPLLYDSSMCLEKLYDILGYYLSRLRSEMTVSSKSRMIFYKT